MILCTIHTKFQSTMKLPRDWEVFSRVSFLLMVRFLAAKTQHILPTSEHAFVRFLVHTRWVRVPSEYVCSALVLAMIVFVWVNVPCCIYILNSHVFYQQIFVLTKTTVINQTMLSLLNYWRRDPSWTGFRFFVRYPHRSQISSKNMW